MRIDSLAEVIRILAFILPIAGLTVIGQSLLQRNLEFKKYTVCIFISHFISQVLVAIPLALIGYGYYSLVFSTLAQNVVLLILVSYLTKGHGIWRFSLTSAKHLSNYGFGQTLGEFFNYTSGQADRLIVARYLGTFELGLYGRAYQLLLLPANLMGMVIDKVLFPSLSSIQNDNKRLLEVYNLAISLVFILSVPVMVFMYTGANDIIVVILGSQWIGVANVLQVFILILFFRSAYKLSDTLSKAKGSVYRRAWRQLIYAFSVFLFSFLGSFYGTAGVAVGVSIAIVMNFFLMLHLAKQLIFLSYKRIVKTLVLNYIIVLLSVAMIKITLFHLAVFNNPVLNVALIGVLSIAYPSILFYVFRRQFKSEIIFVKSVFFK